MRNDTATAAAPPREATERTDTMTTDAWRAADTAYAGPGACYAEDRVSAEAYTDNPGFGGATIYEVRIALDARILDLTGPTRRARLAGIVAEQQYCDECTEIVADCECGDDQWAPDADRAADRCRDRCYTPYIHDAVEEYASDIAAAGWTHVRYQDSYPEDCITIQRVGTGHDILTEENVESQL